MQTKKSSFLLNFTANLLLFKHPKRWLKYTTLCTENCVKISTLKASVNLFFYGLKSFKKKANLVRESMSSDLISVGGGWRSLRCSRYIESTSSTILSSSGSNSGVGSNAGSDDGALDPLENTRPIGLEQFNKI